MKYKTIDLCAGIGGIRRGFELTNSFENVLSAENDKYACITYKHIYHENPMNDITTNKFKNLVKTVDYDVLLAGFPCQAFSAVGKKEGFKDKLRGTIFFYIADIIDETRPKAFLLENVEGLITHNKGKTFNTILDTLINHLNYHIVGISKNEKGDFIYERSDLILNAKNFGLPQNRPRVYLLGINKEFYGNKIEKIKDVTLPKYSDKRSIYKDLNDVLSFKEDKKYYLSEQYVKTLKKHKSSQKKKGNGFGYCIVNDTSIKNPIANTILATGGSGKERNLIYDPQKEVEGIIVKNKKSPINNEGIRNMTPSEWAKLQGFKGYAFIEDGVDKFTFPKGVSNTQLYKQLGNSVAIPVIEEIANLLLKIFDILNRRR